MADRLLPTLLFIERNDETEPLSRVPCPAVAPDGRYIGTHSLVFPDQLVRLRELYGQIGFLHLTRFDSGRGVAWHLYHWECEAGERIGTWATFAEALAFSQRYAAQGVHYARSWSGN